MVLFYFWSLNECSGLLYLLFLSIFNSILLLPSLSFCLHDYDHQRKRIIVSSSSSSKILIILFDKLNSLFLLLILRHVQVFILGSFDYSCVVETSSRISSLFSLFMCPWIQKYIFICLFYIEYLAVTN